MSREVDRVRAELEKHRRKLRAFSRTFEPPVKQPADLADAAGSLVLRIASLANTGVRASSELELYAARALTRCVAEHWIRLMALLSESIRPTASSDRPDYWTILASAEKVDADRRIRRSFPTGSVPTNVPGWVSTAIASEVIDPEPSDEMRRTAKQVLSEYGFPTLCSALALNLRGDDWIGSDHIGMMAFAYARFSGCVHGGPLAHAFLAAEEQNPARAIAGTAADLLIPWTTALTSATATRHGREGAATRVALENQANVLRWIGSAFPEAIPR